MPFSDFEHEELIRGLTDNFNVLADEVQSLSDRKTILEHKLRFAHEQYQRLADKYAPGDTEISNILAKLQLPPELQPSSADRVGFVPLPLRKQANSKLQTAVVIRDGRKAAQRLTALASKSTGSSVSGRSMSGSRSNLSYSARRTSLSTVLEQDFTVPGKKGSLLCPFSRAETQDRNQNQVLAQNSQDSGMLGRGQLSLSSGLQDTTPHQSADPICAAMYAETTSSARPASGTGSAAKCPIRYLDQHSPEEVAKYFETHKHEIPRSHEICVKRYQRNEEDIRKLDAKYGNLVSMIQGLGQKHQPMLPAKQEEDGLDEEEADREAEQASNKRVENWAQNVSADGIGEEEDHTHEDGEDRDSRFDRPLKEVRVGESPSRPWGISVPILDPPEGQRAVSPPPAPVSIEGLAKPAGRCPFGHGAGTAAKEQSPALAAPQRTVGKCPFGHGADTVNSQVQEQPQAHFSISQAQAGSENGAASELPSPPATHMHRQPAFINPSTVPQQTQKSLPQMVFTGPVFIGYPMDQAITFMQQFKQM